MVILNEHVLVEGQSWCHVALPAEKYDENVSVNSFTNV